MTAATASPQAMRDRLLQAIDSQSNICNMVAVLDVISFLEKHPITKEVLEETRLGKLINDVRRKTKNEDLAKRAKRLLRNWQKLIEPGLGEVLTKNHSSASWSSNGAVSHPHISSPSAPLSGKTELKSRNDFNNFNPEVKEKPSGKRKRDHSEVPAKLSKTTPDRMQNLKQLSTNNTAINGLKIPVNAVKPSGLEYNKPLSTSMLLKASVFQQQAASRCHSRPKSPCTSLHSPPNQETVNRTRQQAQNCHASSSCGVSSDDVGCSTGEKQEYLGNFEKEKVGESVKSVKLKDRRLTFDPITCQIKHSCSKEAEQETEQKPDNQRFELQINQPSTSSFQHTDWKELSRSEIIQSYLSQQSSVLSSSGSHASAARSFKSEDDKKTHVLLKESPPRELPGVNREIKSEDVDRLHNQRWSGVNGCFDSKGNWFDWTECISLDLHEDGSRLNILPYVCLD